MSDVTLERLRGQECHIGRRATQAVAIGTIDGCSRYLHGDIGVENDPLVPGSSAHREGETECR